MQEFHSFNPIKSAAGAIQCYWPVQTRVDIVAREAVYRKLIRAITSLYHWQNGQRAWESRQIHDWT